MKDSFKQIIVKGTFILTISNLVISALNYVSNSLTAKALGPVGFGELSTLFAYLNIFNIPLVILTTLVIVKLGNAEDLKHKVAYEIEQWFGNKFREKKYIFVLSLLSIFFVPALTNLSLYSSITLYILAILSIMGTMYFSLLQGLHLFIPFTFLLVLTSLFRLIGTYLAFIHIGGINSVYLGIISGSLISLYFARKYIKKDKPSASKVVHIRIRDYILRKETLITAFSLLSVALLSNIDIMFVKKMFNATDAGIYGGWSLLAKIVGYFAAPIMSVSLLFFSAKEAKADHKKTLFLIIAGVIFIGISILVLYSHFTNYILLFIFSSKFLGIAPYIPYAALFGMLLTIITLINNYYIAHKSKYSLLVLLSFPVEIVLLSLMGTSLENVMIINVGVGFFITGILTISLLYN